MGKSSRKEVFSLDIPNIKVGRMLHAMEMKGMSLDNPHRCVMHGMVGVFLSIADQFFQV